MHADLEIKLEVESGDNREIGRKVHINSSYLFLPFQGWLVYVEALLDNGVYEPSNPHCPE